MSSIKYQDFDDFAGIIISGAPILITEVEQRPYLELFSFLEDINIPVLGICFGHQMLGLIHGASGIKCTESREDIKVRFSEKSVIWQETGHFIFNEDHCEAIGLPNDFQLLASSNICDVEGMRHNNKPLYGVQFHPETSNANGIKLLINFCKSCQ